MTEHSPLPWKVEDAELIGDTQIYYILDSDTNYIAETSNIHFANHIINLANTHQALVEALTVIYCIMFRMSILHPERVMK